MAVKWMRKRSVAGWQSQSSVHIRANCKEQYCLEAFALCTSMGDSSTIERTNMMDMHCLEVNRRGNS